MKKHTKLPTPLVDLVFKDDDSKKRTALADLEIGATVEATIKTVTDFMTPSSLTQ